MHTRDNFTSVALIAAAFSLPQGTLAQTPVQTQTPKSRRSERVYMQGVQVASPDGRVRFTLLPNAERLTFKVTLDNTTVIETSPTVMKLDGYDLSSGVVFNRAEGYEVNETYP